MENNFIESVKKQFQYYRILGEKAMDQLEETDLFWEYDPESNSVAVIVKHLWGNMLSRWTDFRTTDGEKSWRDRDAEFEITAHPGHVQGKLRQVAAFNPESGMGTVKGAIETLLAVGDHKIATVGLIPYRPLYAVPILIRLAESGRLKCA